MKQKIMIAALALATLGAHAQQKEGKKNIESLCGCYEVEFTYAETFSPDTAYKFHKRETSHALELITPIESSDKKIMLQHMLVVSDKMIIKHWREDWTYEANELLTYKGNNTWEKNKVKPEEVKGKWIQTVWQVDDMPRYQGYSAWINNDGKTYWENTVYSPLPRREHTTRSDYNLMKRTNKIIVTDGGWIQEEDNDKIIRSADGDKLLAEEKGMNTYKKVDDSKCAKAKEEWEANKAFWVHIRKEWDYYIGKQNTIAVKDKVDDEKLYEHLYVLQDEWKEKKLSDKELSQKIRTLFEKFVSEEATAKN